MLVTYDLIRPHQDYDGLYESLKKLGSWWHYLDSTWIIATGLSADEIFQQIGTHIDSDDSVFIAPISRDWYGQLPQEALDWLNSH